MLKLSGYTNKGKFNNHCPENREELTVEQFQKLVTTWDGMEIIDAFSILSGLEADYIDQSKDEGLETAMWQCVNFLFAGRKEGEYLLQNLKLEEIPIPKEITLRTLWQKDNPLLPVTVQIPKGIGGLSIGQAIQARRSLEELKDIRAGLSIITAIYLQPLIDKSKFEHVRAIEIEQTILKMKVTDVFPLGFFLLRKLNQNGSWLTRTWRQLKQRLRRKETT